MWLGKDFTFTLLYYQGQWATEPEQGGGRLGTGRGRPFLPGRHGGLRVCRLWIT